MLKIGSLIFSFSSLGVGTFYKRYLPGIEDKIEKVAVELVSKIRRLHFQEGTSSTARTRQIKEIIEFNSRKIDLDAS